ncbi:hypothetical protein Raf01_78290 [Rugosimonospora africana]|uniref:Uncharacterized protein n=1 Tax=Rugosimonospora africana TaxID=556532 RepID=A0A8J3R0P6_9ACTN|nr:hypothetical protein [Rugosimonospora africana]GIH19657.1 hypothetical protein Raf01_78290 [Rugosimonospora africana]
MEVLRAVVAQRLAAGQGELALGLRPGEAATSRVGGPLSITSLPMGHLRDALTRPYRMLGFFGRRVIIGPRLAGACHPGRDPALLG